MRALVLLLALVPYVSPARAEPPHLDIYPPDVLPSGRPFIIEILRDGNWNNRSLELTAEDRVPGNRSKSYLYVDLDGEPLANLILVREDRFTDDPSNVWIHSDGWRVSVPALDPGEHTIEVSYEYAFADRNNRVVPTVWTFTIGPEISLHPPPRPPKPLERPPGLDTPPTPSGFITLFDITSYDVVFRPIADLLITDPVTDELSLDLDWLPRDTVVTYGGDANYAPFNFTHIATPSLPEPIPAPAAPFALALLALAALRRSTRPATLPPILRGSPCRMPTSSTSASIPAIP